MVHCLNFLQVLIEDFNTTSDWIYKSGILNRLMFNCVIYNRTWIYKDVLSYQLMFSLYHNRVLQQSFTSDVIGLHQSETVRHLGSIRKEEESCLKNNKILAIN